MTSVGSVEIQINLGLAQLIKDADAARILLQQKLKDQKIELDFSTGKAANQLSQISAQILSAKAAAAKDAGEAASLQKQASVLQEMLRYKQQLVEIEQSGISDEDVLRAKQLAAELNKLNLDKIETQFNALQREIKESERASGTFIGKLNAQAQAFQEGVSKASLYTQALTQVGQQLTATGQSINQFASQAQQAAIAFDSARAKVSTLSNDADGLASTMKDLAVELEFQSNSTDLLNASYDVLSSGISKTSDVANVLKASTQGALGGFSDVGTVSDAVTTLISAYKSMGMTAADATKIVDILAQTQDKGKITIGQYASQIGQVASTAALAGVSIEEMSAAVATATAKGQDSSSAISGVRQAIINLLKPTDEAQKYLKKFGVENSAAALKTEGLVGILEKLKKGGATTDELAKIFSDVTGLATVATIANENLGDFKGNLDAMGKSAGKAAAAAEKVANSMQGKLTAATNQANEALVDLGNGVVKALLPLLDAITFLIENFNDLPTPVKEATGVVIALSGGFLTLAGAVVAFAAVLPSINAGLKLMGINGLSAGAGATAAGTGATAGSVGMRAMATSAGVLLLKMGLITVAFEVLREVLGRFSDGGQEFNDAANEIQQKLRDIQTDAQKAKADLEGVLPKKPQPTGFIDKVIFKFNEINAASNKLVGLPPDFLKVPTDAEKKLNDARIGVDNLQKAIGSVIDTGRDFKGSTEEAAKVQGAYAEAIKQSQDSLKGLDASAIGTEAYDELKAKIEGGIQSLEKEKASFEKRNGLQKAAAKTTKDTTAAIAEQVKGIEKSIAALDASANALEKGYKLRQAEIVTSVAQGFKTEEQGRQAQLQAEGKYLAERLKLNERKLSELRQLRAITKDQEKQKSQDDQILQLDQQLADQRLQIAQNNASKRQAVEEEALRKLEQAIAATQNKISQSKAGRVLGVRQQQAAGGLSKDQADSAISQIEKDTISQNIAARQRELAETRKLKQQGVLDSQEFAQREAAIISDLGSLSIQQVELEISAQERVKAQQEKALAERKRREQEALAERKKLEGELLQSFEERAKDEVAAANRAEAEKVLAIKQRLAAGAISEDDAQQQITQIQADSADRAVRIKEDELARIQELRASGQITTEEASKQAAETEKQLVGEVLDARQSAAEADLAITEQIKQARIAAIDAEMAARTSAAELENQFLIEEKTALQSRSDLLSAQSALLQAQLSLTEQRIGYAIQEAEAQGRTSKAESLKRKLLREQTEEQKIQQVIEEEQLRLKQEQNALELESQQIQAQVAVTEADIAIQKAIINGATEQEIQNLQRVQDLRQRQLDALDKQAASQAKINALEAEALQTKQLQTNESLKQQKKALDAATRLGGTGGGSSGGSSGGALGGATNITAITDKLTDLGRNSDLATAFSAANLGLGLKLGLTPSNIGGSVGASSIGGNEISGKLDQLIAATKQSAGRPNLSISNVNDLGLAGQIYGDISRDSLRSAGL